jgi:hypothetical protein
MAEEKIMLEIPFFKNSDENQCGQVAAKSAIKYFLNKDISLEELDRLTKHKGNFWTYTPQLVPMLYELGLNVKYFSKAELEPLLKGESYFRKHFGKDAENILKYSDMEAIAWSIKTMQKYNLFELRVPGFEEIEKHVEEGHLPILLVNANIISGKNGLYQGHYLIMTGFDDKYAYCHDSGPGHPTPNMKIEKSTLLKAWNANGTDNDLVIVYGKR